MPYLCFPFSFIHSFVHSFVHSASAGSVKREMLLFYGSGFTYPNIGNHIYVDHMNYSDDQLRQSETLSDANKMVIKNHIKHFNFS